MKKAIVAVAIATLAATNPAGAANLRAPESKTLLQRCTNGAKVTECCAQEKGQHQLYQHKDDSNPGRLGNQCCSRSLGTWLPTNGDDVDKFCSLGQRTAEVQKGVDQMKSLTDRTNNALTSLNEEKSTLKKEFREAYIAHEKQEDDKNGEILRDQKELQLIEDRNAREKTKLNGLNAELGRRYDVIDLVKRNGKKKIGRH